MAWIILRVAVLVVGLAQGPLFLDSLKGDFSRPSLSVLVILIVVVGSCASALIALSRPSAASGGLWPRPSWRTNPLTLSAPVSLTAFIGQYFAAGAISCAVAGFSREPVNWAWELPAGVAVGLLLAVMFARWLFANRFS
jgi:hypothetical protein